MKIKHIGFLSLDVNMALFGALLGLLMGIVLALGALIGGGSSGGGEALALSGAIGIWAVVAFPIGYAIAMFIGGVISALIYNLVFKLSGGLVIDIQS